MYLRRGLATVLMMIAGVVIRRAVHRRAALHRLFRREHAKTIESKCRKSDVQCYEKNPISKPKSEPDEPWRLSGQHDLFSLQRYDESVKREFRSRDVRTWPGLDKRNTSRAWLRPLCSQGTVHKRNRGFARYKELLPEVQVATQQS